MNDYNPNDLNAVLARMEAKQLENSGKLDTVLSSLEGQKDRISSLESFRVWVLGAAAGISAAVSMFGDKIKKLFAGL